MLRRSRSEESPAYAGDRPTASGPGFVLAAMFLGAILLLGIVMSISLALVDDPATPTAPAPPPGAGDGSGPAPGPISTAVPAAAPRDVRWESTNGLVLPYSRSAGPRRIDGSVASGFARTPTGALIAAVQLSARASSAFVPDHEDTMRLSVVPGPDRDALLAKLRAQPQVPPDPGEFGRIVGFVFNSYTASVATVTLAVRIAGSPDTPMYQAATFTVVWQRGDWRLVPPPRGDYNVLVNPAPSLVGFVPWRS
jgi:hypothetical protein